jgi:hypothetical protein
MQARLGAAVLAAVLPCFVSGAAEPDNPKTIDLSVPAGVPIRVYLTKRIPKKAGTPVEAKLLDTLWAYDRPVVPAGAVVSGVVRRIGPVPKMERAKAVLGGDFTPLHTAWIEFTEVHLPDGKTVPLHTVESAGMNSLVPGGTVKMVAAQQANSGVMGSAKQKAKDAMHAEIDRAKSVILIAKAPGKKDRLYDFLMSKLPYHPQYFRNGTRFDAELREPVSFGTETLQPGSLAAIGSEPSADMVAHARLITGLDSASAQLGEPVEAVLSAPLFSPNHHLVLPEGTRLLGSVVVAKPARWFHRGGQLRFTFSSYQIPPALLPPPAEASPAVVRTEAAKPRVLELRTRATLQAAESDGKTPVKIDSEGGVEAKESKTRFIAPAISALIARAAADNDPERAKDGTITGQNPNVGGRTLGGVSGFGLLGAVAAQSSRYVGTAFGFYGLAWSVYSNIIARGFEIDFPKNAMVDVRFNTRAAANP